MRGVYFMKKKLDNHNLFTLVLIVIICSMCRLFGGKLNLIAYLCLLMHFKIIITAKNDEILPILLFNHTCSALYDFVGFTYLFNFSIFIFVIKLFLQNKSFPKKSSLLLIILFLYNNLLVIFGNYFNLNAILSTCSLFFSYLFIVKISSNYKIINYEKCYRYFFVGFVFSAIGSFAIPFSRWGFNIPKAYRFTGYLRDPNYFSIDALLVMNISMILYKRFNIKYFIILFISIFSVSKMFLGLSIFNFLIYLMISLFNKNKKVFFVSILIVFFLPLFLLFATKTNYYNVILDKYVYRSEVSGLFTGRDYLQTYYIRKLKNEPKILLLGSSLSYRYLLKAGTDSYTQYENFGAHNTYLDILLSWGIFGAFLYFCFLSEVRRELLVDSHNKYKVVYSYKEFYILLLSVLISLFALSYLNIDFFAILILLLMLYSPKVKYYVDNTRWR